MRFGVNSRAYTPYPIRHRGRLMAANGESREGNPVSCFMRDVETNDLDRLSRVIIDT